MRHKRQDQHQSAGERHVARRFGEDQPDPDRREDRFQQVEHRHFRRREEARAGCQAPEGKRHQDPAVEQDPAGMIDAEARGNDMIEADRGRNDGGEQ